MKTAQTHRLKIGRFEYVTSASDETSDVYIFTGNNFLPMKNCLDSLINVHARLYKSIARLQGIKIENPVIPTYRDDGTTNDFYHLKDCTLEFFRDKNDNRAYLTIINKDHNKRQEALKVLEEVFS